MNRILIVTSQVTFVPRNYANLFSEFLKLREKDIEFKNSYKIKVVLLKNRSPLLIIKALVLILTGAPRIGFHLLKNTICSYFGDERVKILKQAEINTFYFKTPNSLEFRNFLRQEKIDLLVNARTRFIYKRKTLNSPKLGAYNIHHGILPDNRGTMCDLWAMYKNEKIGFSLHQMNEKIDDGRIIKVYTHSTENSPKPLNYVEYLEQSSTIEGRALFEFVRDCFKEIEQHGIERISIANTPVKKLAHTKNPTFKEIWKMKLKGIKL